MTIKYLKRLIQDGGSGKVVPPSSVFEKFISFSQKNLPFYFQQEFLAKVEMVLDPPRLKVLFTHFVLYIST
jgi:hypothetical protein